MAAYSARFGAALELAAHAHRHQTRKGSDVPYIVHPVHVSTILARCGFDEDVVLAGLLHDVVEDSGVPLDRIEGRFGSPVASIVAALTERKRDGQGERPWALRKEEALVQLRESGPDAAAVKAADVIHNSRSLEAQLRERGVSIWEAYRAGAKGTLWYYGSVARVVRRALVDHPLIDELDAAIGDLELIVSETAHG